MVFEARSLSMIPMILGRPNTMWMMVRYCESLFLENTHLHSNATETTVVTLADWYHAKAKTLTFPYVMLEEWQLE